MTSLLARNPLQSIPMSSTNRPVTRRRSAKRDLIDDDDAPPAPKRSRTETNGSATGSTRAGGAAGKQTSATSRKGAKAAAYDEDDDGFTFTRRTTRRTAAKSKAPDPIPEEPVKTQPPRKRKNSVAPPEPAQEELPRRRRSARLSGENPAQAAIAPQPVKAPTKAPAKRVRKTLPIENEPPPERPDKSVAAVGLQTPRNNDGLHVPKTRDLGATKIKLPFADTPVITRNKEMRKASKDGHRRSSTGLRGRRASSLIDSGKSNALPHSEVELREFYKYIEQSIPEPRRMRQLLTWCGSRALVEKPSGNVKDSNAIMAARAIQQELIDDFANKTELSDWFSREDVAPVPKVMKPNPQNIKNEASLKQLEEEIKRLEEEKAAWEALKSSSRSTSQSQPLAPKPSVHSLADVDSALLDPSQASILSSLQTTASKPTTGEPQPASSAFAFTYTTPTALQSHLANLSLSLEPNIDLLADGVHKIQQYRNTAERAADRVLGAAARTLEEKDQAVKETAQSESIGVRDVLRGLAGVLNER